MRTFLSISATAALITMAVVSCGGDRTTADQEKDLVYEGSRAEPQIGEQADTLTGNTMARDAKSK